MRDLGAAPTIRRIGAGNRRTRFVEGERPLGERDEDEPFDDLEMNPLQPVARSVEIGRHMTRGSKPSVEIITPGVIGADENGRMAGGASANARSAMAANIDEGTQLTILAAQDDDAFLRHLMEKPVTGVRRARFMPRENPVPQEDPLHVMVEGIRAVVERLMQRMRRGLAPHKLADAIGLGDRMNGHRGGSGRDPFSWRNRVALK